MMTILMLIVTYCVITWKPVTFAVAMDVLPCGSDIITVMCVHCVFMCSYMYDTHTGTYSYACVLTRHDHNTSFFLSSYIA